ncbi:sensor domain-containing diguanylate cyclase [Aurantimonas sp. A2-1-M11]|uniref:sensor domain-containing diguanylate cyclase n=1 Tax=Aurantimonas sp. A2-1-M11 TaxID=3113712 RepID=UPI002F930646
MRKILSATNRLRDQMSMKQQSALLTALLSILVVAAMTMATAYLIRDRAVDTANAEMHDLAQSMADRLDQEMFERFREIGNFASLATLNDSWDGDRDGIRRLVDQLQATLPRYAWIGYASLDGEVLASTGRTLEGASVAERPWFAAGTQATSALDLHEAKLLADILGPSVDGEPFRFVDVAAPVRDEAGYVKGVLGAHLSWSWAQSVRSYLLNGMDPNLQTDLWVTASDGTAILGAEFGQPVLSPDRARLVRQTFVGGEGEATYLASAVATRGYEAYPGLGWIVVAKRPMSVVLADANRVTLVVILIGLIAAAAGIAAAFLIAGRVTNPLTRLAADADRLGRQVGGTAVFDRQRGSSDILRLSSSLRSLMRRVDSAESDATEVRGLMERSEQAYTIKTREHQETVRNLRQLADTDPMTGLMNRRSFLGDAKDVLSFFRRYDSRFAILMIDIDHFKRVNDAHGHAIGDDVIRSVARVLAEAARQTDRVARFGGEEFVVLLREIDETSLAAWAERMRNAVQATVLDTEAGPVSVTVSVGATLVSPGDRDVEDVLHRADLALYSSKSNGRNMLTVSQGLEVVDKAA